MSEKKKKTTKNPSFCRSVDIFTVPELVQLCSIKLHRKLVNTVRWHPGYLTLSEELSACRHWLAVGSNDLFVSVVDLKNVLGA